MARVPINVTPPGVSMAFLSFILVLMFFSNAHCDFYDVSNPKIDLNNFLFLVLLPLLLIINLPQGPNT